MANDATTGKQLFIDLIAASSQPRPRSAFESVAWAVAAEHAGAQGIAARVDATSAEGAAPSALTEASADQSAVGPVGGTIPAAPVSSALRLIEDLDEPPLHSLDPAGFSPRPSPGPRIMGFASATGAALASIPSMPLARDSRTPAPDSSPGSPGLAPGDGAERPSPVLDEPHRAPAAGTVDATDDAADDSSLLAALVTEPRPAAVAGPDPAAAAAGPMAPTPARGTALLEDDDDFGPLILPEDGHRHRWLPRRGSSGSTEDTAVRPRRERRRMRSIALTTTLVVAVVAVAGAWWLRPAPATPTPPAKRADVVMQDWHGIALPISTAAGPAGHSDTRASGFARTPLGAAIAAAHLSVRTDPAAGPEVFEPVLADQVVGDVDRLAGAVREQFNAGIPEGAPGQLLGWRVEGDPASGSVVAHLQVRHADGTVADYAVPLAWVAGDWQIDVPESGAFFPVTGPSGPYASFVEEATP